jgi:UPF0716 protein FxsA
MPAVLFLVLVAVPLLEIALLIKVGQSFGFWPTLGLVIGTALLGTILLRQQGFAVWNRIVTDLQAGRPPVDHVADGFLILLAGAFLVSPGIITDTLGVLLLIPPVRALVRRFLASRITASGGIFTSEVIVDAPPRAPGSSSHPPRSGSRGSGPVIDGDYERVDDPPRK